VIQPVISKVTLAIEEGVTYGDTLSKLEHLLRHLILILLSASDQNTLQSLRLLPELQEHNLGSLGSHVVQPSPKDDVLSDHLFRQLGELEPSPSRLFLTLVKRELSIVLRSVID